MEALEELELEKALETGIVEESYSVEVHIFGGMLELKHCPRDMAQDPSLQRTGAVLEHFEIAIDIC